MDDFEYKETRFGFDWGPMTIKRCCSDPGWGVLIEVGTDREFVEIRSTPTGYLRIGKVTRVEKK